MHRVLFGALALRNTDSAELPAILSTSSFSSALASMLSTNAVDVKTGLDVENLLRDGNAPVLFRGLISALLKPTSNGLRRNSQSNVARANAVHDEELFQEIFLTVDEISLPIYRMALEILVHLSHKSDSIIDDDRLQQCIIGIVKLAMQSPGRCWLQLLPVLTNGMLSEVRDTNVHLIFNAKVSNR